MHPPLAGLVEGALIGGAIGLVVGIVMAFLPGKPCPQCQQPLPKPWLRPPTACPKCGCKLNAKGQKADDGRDR